MLKIRQLKFSFQHQIIFDRFSLELEPGDVLHVMGPNGSGKSTLLPLIAGLRNENDDRCIEFIVDGRIVNDRRTCISYLAAENNGLYTHLSARQNLEFWAQINVYFGDECNIPRSLERWGLSHPALASVPVSRFSTGMKRRLGLARVDMSRRPCLLLDEPLNGLDKQAVAIFKSMIQEHRHQKGLTIIVSHEMQCLSDLVTKEISLA